MKPNLVYKLPEGCVGPSNQDNTPALPCLDKECKQVPTTSKYWSSLVWKHDPTYNGTMNLFSLPNMVKITSEETYFGCPNSFSTSPYHKNSFGVNTHEWHSDVALDLAFQNTPGIQPKLLKYSDWAFTARTGLDADYTLVQGCPFMYINLHKDCKEIKMKCTSPCNNLLVEGNIISLTINNRKYAVFASIGSSWTQTENEFTCNLKNPWMSVCSLPDNKIETFNEFKTCCYSFIVDTTVNWTYDESNAKVINTFTANIKPMETVNVEQPILGIFKHQYKYMLPETKFLTSNYTTCRGTMKLVQSNTFTYTNTFNGVVPYLPVTEKNDFLYGMVETVFKQSSNVRWNNSIAGMMDTYFYGKAMCRVGELIHVANMVNHIEARDLFISELQAKIEPWLIGGLDNSPYYFYDNNWKVLIGYPSSFGADTGLNDIHFHAGYFIRAAAILAQYTPEWIKKYDEMIMLLIKNSANYDRKDEMFPYMRNHDQYMAMSYASGSALFGNGNNQESSSESINFANSVYQYGLSTNNKVVRDVGIYLYTNEVQSIEEYWFEIDKDVSHPEYPEPCSCMVWSNGLAYCIWWNGDIYEFHGINFLPITSASVYLAKHPEYLKINQDWMYANAANSQKNKWIDVHLQVKAMFNSESAKKEIEALDYAEEQGDSKGHTYATILSFNELGKFVSNVTCNVPSYNVFNKDGVFSYVVYSKSVCLVKFSDGISFEVPENKLVVYRNKKIVKMYEMSSNAVYIKLPPKTVDIGFKHGKLQLLLTGETTVLEYIPETEIKWCDLHYSINDNNIENVKMKFSEGKWSYKFGSLDIGAIFSGSLTYFSTEAVDTEKIVYANTKIDSVVPPVIVEKPPVVINKPVENTPVVPEVDKPVVIEKTPVEPVGPVVPANPPIVIDKPVDNNVFNFEDGKIEITKNDKISTITFCPTTICEFVDISYKINNNLYQNIRMDKTEQNLNWNVEIMNLNQDDLIQFSFTYFQNFGKNTSKFIWKKNTNTPNTNNTTTTNTTTNTDTANDNKNTFEITDAKIDVNHVNDQSSKITFTPKKECSLVDFHYTIENKLQQNVRMINTNNSWTYDFELLKNENLNFSFTYVIDSLGNDTSKFNIKK